MRKFFYTFLFAAAALLSSCGVDEPTPEIDLSDEYMGLELMNHLEVYYRGDFYNDGGNNFVVYVGQAEDKEGTSFLRRAVFELNTTKVNEANVPVGTFSIQNGDMMKGNADQFLVGSYYLRQTDSPFYMLMEEATLTIADNGDGTYAVEAKVSGNEDFTAEPEVDENGDLEEPEIFPDFEFKLTATPVMTGMNKATGPVQILPNCVLGEQTYAPVLSAYYDVEQGFAKWEFELIDFPYYYLLTQQQLVDYHGSACVFTVYKQLTGDEEFDKIIPTGNIIIDGANTGYLNTALGTQVVGYDFVDGQLIEFGDSARDGSFNIKVEGDGVYTVSGIIYGTDNAYTFTTTAPIYFEDLTQVTMQLDPTDAENGTNGLYIDYQENVAGNMWVLTGMDSRNGLILELKLAAGDEDTTNGVPSGTYTLEDGSLLPSSAIYDAEGAALGITDGSVTVENIGNGTYSVRFELIGEDTVKYFGSGMNTMVGVNYPSAYNLSVATGLFVGAGGWYIDLYDLTKLSGKGLAMRLLMITEETAAFADGLPAGTYTFSETGAPGTMLPGMFGGDGYYYSMLISADGRSLYALFAGGEVEVSRGGADYTFDVNISDTDGNIYRGVYAGPLQTQDASASAAPAKARRLEAIQWSNFESNAQREFNPNIEKKHGPLIK